MHIAEGFLPLEWYAVWYAIAVPVVAYGISRLGDVKREGSE
jgi:cobalt/nickel transport system permease protein